MSSSSADKYQTTVSVGRAGDAINGERSGDSGVVDVNVDSSMSRSVWTRGESPSPTAAWTSSSRQQPPGTPLMTSRIRANPPSASPLPSTKSTLPSTKSPLPSTSRAAASPRLPPVTTTSDSSPGGALGNPHDSPPEESFSALSTTNGPSITPPARPPQTKRLLTSNNDITNGPAAPPIIQESSQETDVPAAPIPEAQEQGEDEEDFSKEEDADAPNPLDADPGSEEESGSEGGEGDLQDDGTIIPEQPSRTIARRRAVFGERGRAVHVVSDFSSLQDPEVEALRRERAASDVAQVCAMEKMSGKKALKTSLGRKPSAGRAKLTK